MILFFLFFFKIWRCMPQKCQLLWEQGSHPHDALPLSGGSRRFPAGCASGWLFHEGEFELLVTYRTSLVLSASHIMQCTVMMFWEMSVPSHRGIYVRASATCLWEMPWQPIAAFRRFWNWSRAIERPSRRWEALIILFNYYIKTSIE